VCRRLTRPRTAGARSSSSSGARGPDLSVTEPVFGATARGAARHLGYPEIAALL